MISSETVNPMPDRAPPASVWPRPTPCGRRPQPSRTPARTRRRCPTALPTTRPSTMPHISVEVKASPSTPSRRSTPALASAKTGTTTWLVGSVQRLLQPLVDRDRAGQRAPGRALHARHRRLAEGAEPARRLLDVRAPRVERRDQQAAQHAGDRGVHAGLEGRDPEHEDDQDVGRRLPHPRAVEDDQDDQARRGDGQRAHREVVGVDDADHADRDDVVDDGQREQEDPQLRRHRRPDQRHHAQQEGGVGADHGAPAGGLLTGGVEREEDRGRHEHAGDAGDERDDGAAAVGELADGELLADLEADHEEEHDHQAVVDPVVQVHRDAAAAEPDESPVCQRST